MRQRIDPALTRYNVDRRLQSAAQTHAGARCHESGNLLAAYSLAVQLHDRSVERADRDGAQWARELIDRSEVALRQFVFQSKHPGRMAVPA